MISTRTTLIRKLAGGLLAMLALSCVLPVPRTGAAELTDLGQGLGYLRVHSLDAALKPLAGSGALVLDLRQSSISPETSAAFRSALSNRATPGSPLFVLVGPSTPATFVQSLPKDIITLGISSTQPAPRVIVDQTPEADRLAYDALEAGTDVNELISGRIEKERYDEASLVQEFKGGNLDAHPPLKKPSAAGGTTLPEPDQKNERLTDRVLQRAVHLHRALQALKRG
ncbi:MAG: hypothetical protein RL091_1466 [Verrucomicrobiota bacterium]